MSLLYSSGRIVTTGTPGLWRNAIVAALHEIERCLGEPISDPVAVHAARRAAKQVRALALLAPASLAALTQETRAHADALRRALGDARDAEVRRHTFEALKDQAGPAAGELLPLLRDTTVQAATPVVPDHLPAAIGALARSWATIDLSQMDKTSLPQALAKTYGRARKRGRKAKNGDTEALHRWRRAAVDLDLQLGPFTAGSPEAARMAKHANTLRDLLGKVHDIDALLAFLAERPDANAAAVEALMDAALRERKHLTRKIKKHAKRMFEHGAKRWEAALAGQLAQN